MVRSAAVNPDCEPHVRCATKNAKYAATATQIAPPNRMPMMLLPKSQINTENGKKASGGLLSHSSVYGRFPSRMLCPISMNVLSSQLITDGKKNGNLTRSARKNTPQGTRTTA